MAGVIRSQRLSADLGQPQTEPPIMPRPPLAIPLMALALVIGPVRPSPADDEGWTRCSMARRSMAGRSTVGSARYAVEDGTIVGTTSGRQPEHVPLQGRLQGDWLLELEVK